MSDNKFYLINLNENFSKKTNYILTNKETTEQPSIWILYNKAADKFEFDPDIENCTEEYYDYLTDKSYDTPDDVIRRLIDVDYPEDALPSVELLNKLKAVL